MRAGNGTISFEELAGVMASLGHGEEALAVFREVHGSAKGAITFDEFCAVWKLKFGRPAPPTRRLLTV